MGFLDLPGLQYFYNKYVKGLKSHAFRDPANNLTTTASGYALDARQGKALKDQLDEQNSAFAKSNMDVVWVNQEGAYTFPLPIGKMAVVITYRGIYPHYSSSSGISANQLGGDTENENVITSVNNAQHTVSVYNKGDGATQAVILMPRQ